MLHWPCEQKAARPTSAAVSLTMVSCVMRYVHRQAKEMQRTFVIDVISETLECFQFNDAKNVTFATFFESLETLNCSR